MAFVPRSVHDVFVSYAHVDNEGACWVSRFRDELERELRAELALWGNRRISVWQDLNRLKPGYAISASIRGALERTAVLISLWSPGYLASGYCGEEASAFRAACGSQLLVNESSRLIDVLIRPSSAVTSIVGGGTIYANLSQNGWPGALDSPGVQQQFRNLVTAIASLLRQLRDRWPGMYVSLPSAGSAVLEEKTVELLEDLSQAGYRRTSENHPSFYRETSQLEAEIAQGLMSVCLIDDPEDSLVLRQVESALRTGKPTAVWFSPKARTCQIPALKRIRESGCEYSEESIPEFSWRVKQRLDQLQRGEAVPGRAERRRTIFVLFHPGKDRGATGPLLRRIEAEEFDVAKPGKGADRTIKESDGVLLYQKEAADEWFDSKLRTVGAAPAVKAVCVVNPPDKAKSKAAARDFKFRDLREVDRQNPRLLLEGDEADSLTAFFALVRRRD